MNDVCVVLTVKPDGGFVMMRVGGFLGESVGNFIQIKEIMKKENIIRFRKEILFTHN